MPSIPAGLALAVALAALLASASAAQESTASVDASLLSLITVGAGLGEGWKWAGYGCQDCVFADRLRRRNGSTSSVFAAVVPWGNSIFESNLPFTGLSVLDTWVKGSVLSNGAMYLEDTINRRQSRMLTLDAAAMGDARVLAGPTDDGWYHLQVNFVKLSDASGTKLTALPSMWNRICILDKSGTGYTLQLDTTFLYSSDTFPFQTSSEQDPAAPFPCVGNLCSARPAARAPPPQLVPLYDGEDFTVQGDMPVDASTSFILRLKPNVSNEELAAICQELQSTDDGASRFNGSCQIDPQVAHMQEEADPTSPVDWSFQTFSVESSADLLAMRSSLGDVVQYFERDRTATVDYIPEATIELPGDVATIDAAVPWGNLHAPGAHGLDRIDQASLPLDGAYVPGLDGTGVHVYVLDTGLRTTHVEFTGRIGESVSFTSGYAVAGLDSNVAAQVAVANAGCLPDDLDCMQATIGDVEEGKTELLSDNDSARVEVAAVWDGHGHGTHVSGIALGTQYGVAKLATLHAVKTMGDDGSGSYSNIIAGMNWVVQHVKRNGWRGVVNMSLGGPRSTALNDAAQQLINAGIPVVTSAGNKYGADACSQSPASNPQAIAVASSDQSDQLSSFSNIGSCVDIFAPGSSITSAGISSDTASAIMSGTSMASPHTAGVVSLVLQAFPTASVADVAAILTNSSQRIVFSTTTAPYFLQAQKARLAPNYGKTTTSPTVSPLPAVSPTTSLTPSPAGTASPVPNARPVATPVSQPALGKLVVGYS